MERNAACFGPDGATTGAAGGRSFTDLPDIEALFDLSGTDVYSHDFAALFGLDAAMARAGTRRLVVFRNADLRAIATHPAAGNMPWNILIQRAFSDGSPADAVTDAERAHMTRFSSNQIFTSNAPIHEPTRAYFARPLMPKFMQHFAAVADAIVPGLIDEVVGQGEIDFSFQFTEKLTARFWGAVIGMTAEECDRMVEAVRGMTPVFFLYRTRDELLAANAATGEYLELITTTVDRALAGGGNALLAEMAAEFDAIAVQGKPESLGVSIAANLIDGFHTAALAGTNSIYHLLRNPDALRAVCADPKLVGNALAEGLRLSPPIIVTHRYALEPFVHGGVEIPAGMAIAMLWAAGNRDPAVHADPGRYDLMRPQRLSTTFGGGIHICPGRNVARVLADAVLRGVTAPGIRLELTGEVDWIPRTSVRQAYRMPIAISRA